jgi:hypothetical protein
MLGMEAGDILGHVLKAVAIAFGITMALMIIRSMRGVKQEQKQDKASGQKDKP